MDPNPNLSLVERQLMLQLDLEDQLANKTECDSKNLIENYLSTISKRPIKIKNDFKDLKWLNISKPLSLETDLAGLITLCDFFTYCCINCLHVLPFLNQIEETYHDKEVIVIGVHSPKFENEKSLKNVINAIIRHQISHPVCNDPELKLWEQLSINCWPTVAIINPNGELSFLLIGERSIQTKLKLYTDVCLDYFSNEKLLDFSQKKTLLDHLRSDYQNQNQLNYPTKISLSPDSKRLSIANSLSNSIIVSTVSGIIEYNIGSKIGHQDGFFEDASFNFPQGMCWINPNIFYVCDTENNAIRKVDLNSKTVETVIRNGQSPLNSPWDLIFNPNDNRLYIAMAGSHQIWTYILSEEGDTIHGQHYPYGSFVCFAGDGMEQKRNHRSALQSSFAQPSGLAIKSDIIYVADSESSSIRTINLGNNSVSTLVGGSPNPLDLFAFGDQDGIGSKCRLQHCMGVCPAGCDSIFIADTYNHKIKKIDIPIKKCDQLVVLWNEIEDGIQGFNEPNGLCLFEDQNVLLVADTNNHRIISINLQNGLASKFNLVQLDSSLQDLEIQETVDSANPIKPLIYREKLMELIGTGKIEFIIGFKFIGELKADKNAKHRIKTSTHSDLIQIEPKSLMCKDLNEIKFNVLISPANNLDSNFDTELSFECNLNLCHSNENYCILRKFFVIQPLLITKFPNDQETIIQKRISIDL